ncbi:MAG: hypothetical protein R6W71_12400 [Bacteroidales bacterium]|jgi:hypothetical protein
MKAAAFLLIMAIGTMIVNNVVFIHEHILPDGTVVTHAHPYDKSEDPEEKHQHSKAEFVLLDNLKVISTAVVFSLIIWLPFIYIAGLDNTLPVYLPAVCLFKTGRSPPST